MPPAPAGTVARMLRDLVAFASSPAAPSETELGMQHAEALLAQVKAMAARQKLEEAKAAQEQRHQHYGY